MPSDRKGWTPIVRKKKKGPTIGSTIFTPPSVISGIPHTVEGTKTTLPDAPETRSGGMIGSLVRQVFPQKLAQEFKEKQEARKRIKSIPDPDDIYARSQRRRSQARRRMRGRAGTILTAGLGSQRQTLG